MKDKKAIFSKFLLYEGQESYIYQDFARKRTEKLNLARFCYVKDRKAIISKILQRKGLKS